MKIEISIGTTVYVKEFNYPIKDTIYEHEGYYDSIDEAIEALQYLKMCEERGDFVE
jgi:hypothetical protein